MGTLDPTVLSRAAIALALAITVAACGGGGSSGLGSVDTTRTIGVNGYLWRAALDTLAPLPLTQADADGGVILTDWYADPDVPGERVKVTVMILDSALRADAVRVSVQRQRRIGVEWSRMDVKAATALAIEEAVLTRARQLRVEEISQG